MMAEMIAKEVQIWAEITQGWTQLDGELVGADTDFGIDEGAQLQIHHLQETFVELQFTGGHLGVLRAIQQPRQLVLPAPQSAHQLTWAGKSWQVWFVPRWWLRESGWIWSWAAPGGGV